MITVSSPSKVHLLGEHAVVYGKPALLAATDKRVFVTIAHSRRREIRGDDSYRESTQQLLGILENEIRKLAKIQNIGSYSIKINSQIPARFGLGSSASLSASLTAALLSFLEIPWSNKIVFDIAYEGERFFHGNPSGGDLATVIEGGFLWFRKELEFLKTFAHLPFKPRKNIGQFILINSGDTAESTREMVEKVARFKLDSPKKVQLLLDAQENLTKQMAIALKEGDEYSLIECIRVGERNLEKLGVVGKRAQTLVRIIESFQGAAKISGGGGVKEGSGMLLVYHKDPNKLLAYLTIVSGRRLQLNHSERKTPEIIKIKIGEEGLKIHE